MEKKEALKEIKQNALKWLNNNKCMSCKGNGYYPSPRISSEFPDCSTPFSFDLYSYCSYGCLYCFSYFQKTNNPSLRSENALKLKPVNSKKVIEIFEGKHPNNMYYKHFISKRKIMHIGGMADNFCNFERFNKEGLELIEYLLKTGYPIIISSKGTLFDFPEYKELFEKYKDTACCAFQASIITSDDTLAANIEIGVPCPTRRFENLKWLKSLGYYTILRLRPFMVGISEKTLSNMMQAMVDYNIDSLSTEFYAMDMRVGEDGKKRYKWMSDLVGFDYIEYYKKLSPTRRGTYRRLNRDVKEPYIKEMYKFCLENNKIFACSDPDFKELNMTGSCCGLPDDIPGLNNFCVNQLTNHIRLLRQKYMKGEEAILKLKDVILDEEEHEWWLDTNLYDQDCVCAAGMCQAERIKVNFWIQFSKEWNNIRSPKCPVNYFHGKLLPYGRDKDNNIIYKYNPLSYEKLWKKEEWFK